MSDSYAWHSDSCLITLNIIEDYSKKSIRSVAYGSSIITSHFHVVQFKKIN